MTRVRSRSRGLRIFSVLLLGSAAACGGDDSTDTSELTSLRKGDCFDSPLPFARLGFEEESPELDELEVVSCDGPHDGVIVAVDGSQDAFQDDLFCGREVEDYFDGGRPETILSWAKQQATISAEEGNQFLTVCTALFLDATDNAADGDPAAESPTLTDAAQTATVEVGGEPLEPYIQGERDPSVGMPMPELKGVDFGGEPVMIADDDRAKIVLVVAHWDPHGQTVVSDLSAQDLDGGLLGEVDLYLLSTSVEVDVQNYPPSEWLAETGLDTPVLVDDTENSAATALGLTAFPFWVFVDSDGLVAHRVSGKLTMVELSALVAQFVGS